MNSKEILYALQNRKIDFEDAEKEIMKIMEMSSILYNEQNETKEKTVLPSSELPYELPEKSEVVKIEEIEPGVALLTMNDRANKNTFSKELIIGLFQAFHSIENNHDYKVIILTGYDTYFVSGGNQEGLLDLYEGKTKMTDLNVYTLPIDCKIPVIAAMQGHGIGGGWCFGMFSDFVVMSKESSYTCNHMKYGFTPGDGATLIFPEKLGRGLAQEVLYTGNRFRGSELEKKGAQIPILPRKEVLPYAIQLAKDLSTVPRESLILLKEHMTKHIKENLAETLEKEWEMQEQTFVNKPKVLEKILTVFEQSGLQKETRSLSFGGMLQSTEVIHLNQSNQGAPIFWLHGEGGGVEGYSSFAQEINRPFYGIQARGRMNHEKPIYGIQAMAAHYVKLIQSLQPEGPYDLGGYSLGGNIAYEVSRQLQEAGCAIRSIVMIDTLDPIGIRKISISRKSKILQGINLSLISRIRQEPEEIIHRLIHQNEVDFELKDEDLLKRLIVIGKTRGLSINKTEAELVDIFQKNAKIQDAFELDKFEILPLPDPSTVNCYYFKNKSGKFYGGLQSYLTFPMDTVLVDDSNYWRSWEENFKNFKVFDVETTNHISMLFEQKAQSEMIKLCKEIYS